MEELQLSIVSDPKKNTGDDKKVVFCFHLTHFEILVTVLRQLVQ